MASSITPIVLDYVSRATQNHTTPTDTSRTCSEPSDDVVIEKKRDAWHETKLRDEEIMQIQAGSQVELHGCFFPRPLPPPSPTLCAESHEDPKQLPVRVNKTTSVSSARHGPAQSRRFAVIEALRHASNLRGMALSYSPDCLIPPFETIAYLTPCTAWLTQLSIEGQSDKASVFEPFVWSALMRSPHLKSLKLKNFHFDITSSDLTWKFEDRPHLTQMSFFGDFTSHFFFRIGGVFNLTELESITFHQRPRKDAWGMSLRDPVEDMRVRQKLTEFLLNHHRNTVREISVKGFALASHRDFVHIINNLDFFYPSLKALGLHVAGLDRVMDAKHFQKGLQRLFLPYLERLDLSETKSSQSLLQLIAFDGLPSLIELDISATSPIRTEDIAALNSGKFRHLTALDLSSNLMSQAQAMALDQISYQQLPHHIVKNDGIFTPRLKLRPKNSRRLMKISSPTISEAKAKTRPGLVESQRRLNEDRKSSMQHQLSAAAAEDDASKKTCWIM